MLSRRGSFFVGSCYKRTNMAPVVCLNSGRCAASTPTTRGPSLQVQMEQSWQEMGNRKSDQNKF